MKYSEETLQTWTASLSQSEEQRAKNTIEMIRSAINGSDELKIKDIEVFTQGSFTNNINVRFKSLITRYLLVFAAKEFNRGTAKTAGANLFDPYTLIQALMRLLMQNQKCDYTIINYHGRI